MTILSCVKKTHVVILLEIMQILDLILSQSLSDVGVLNYIQDRLGFLLQSLVRQERLLSLLAEL